MIYIFIFRFQNKSILWPLKVQLALDTVPPCLTGQTGLLAQSTALHSWMPQMVPSLNTQSCVATFLPWHSISGVKSLVQTGSIGWPSMCPEHSKGSPGEPECPPWTRLFSQVFQWTEAPTAGLAGCCLVGPDLPATLLCF